MPQGPNFFDAARRQALYSNPGAASPGKIQRSSSSVARALHAADDTPTTTCSTTSSKASSRQTSSTGTIRNVSVAVWACVFISALSTLLGIFELTAGRLHSLPTPLQSSFLRGRTIGPSIRAPETLVLYIFSNTDPQYLHNLEFFLREGVRERDGAEYVFVVNHSANDTDLELPPLPRNGRYVHHANECYDWGTFGWVLEHERIDTSKYKRFIFMNSSIRGPFVPTYIRALTQGRINWMDVLFSRITDSVKLMGATINCEGAPLGGDIMKPWRKNPHVQSYLVATDQIGLEVLRSTPEVFKCYEDMHDTIYYSELGSSKAILDAGYNIDSLMVRYQNVDWRNPANWGCNMEKNPYGQNFIDGSSLEAMEVMFVKVKQHLIDARWSYPVAAQKFDEWYQASDAGTPEVHQNAYMMNKPLYRLAEILSKAAETSLCFDCAYYLEHNPDLPRWQGCGAPFEHFVNYGQFETREHRWLCHVPANFLLPLRSNSAGNIEMPQLTPVQRSQVFAMTGTSSAPVPAAQDVQAGPQPGVRRSALRRRSLLMDEIVRSLQSESSDPVPSFEAIEAGDNVAQRSLLSVDLAADQGRIVSPGVLIADASATTWSGAEGDLEADFEADEASGAEALGDDALQSLLRGAVGRGCLSDAEEAHALERCLKEPRYERSLIHETGDSDS